MLTVASVYLCLYTGCINLHLLRHTDFTADFGKVIHTVYLQGRFYSVLMRAFPTALWKNDAVVNSIYML